MSARSSLDALPGDGGDGQGVHVTGVIPAIHDPAFHNSKRRRNERVDTKPKSNTDAAQDRAASSEAQRKAGARRTAWIIAAIAAAFFIASLVQGHLVGIPH